MNIKNVVATMALGHIIATSPIAEAKTTLQIPVINNIPVPSNHENFCQENPYMSNAANNVFALTAPRIGRDYKIRYYTILCDKGKKLFYGQSTVGKPQHDGWVYTPEWNFHIGDQGLSINRTSRTYNNASMPYSVHVTKWIFYHQWRVDINATSHWCIRLAERKAQEFYEKISDLMNNYRREDIKVIIRGTNRAHFEAIYKYNQEISQLNP